MVLFLVNFVAFLSFISDIPAPFFYFYLKRYTCYRRQQNFVAWSYYAGDSNPGLVAEVRFDVCICGIIRCVFVCHIRRVAYIRSGRKAQERVCDIVIA